MNTLLVAVICACICVLAACYLVGWCVWLFGREAAKEEEREE